MTPQDDATWPSCGQHQEPGSVDPVTWKRHWCDWTCEMMLMGEDGRGINAGGRYCVPVVPDLGIYAQVSIGSSIMPGYYQLAVVKTAQTLFTDNETLVDIGLHAEGDGRLILSGIVQDWAAGEPMPEKCTSFGHGFREEMQLQNADAPVFKATNWLLVYEDMCYPCWLKLNDPSSAKPAPDIGSFSASAVGLDDEAFGGAPSRGNRAGETARERRTREMLADRAERARKKGQPTL